MVEIHRGDWQELASLSGVLFFLYVQFIICQVKKKEKKNKKKEDQEEEEEDAASAAAKVCCNTQKAFHYFIFQDPFLEPERNPIYCIIRQHHNQLTVKEQTRISPFFWNLRKAKRGSFVRITSFVIFVPAEKFCFFNIQFL